MCEFVCTTMLALKLCLEINTILHTENEMRNFIKDTKILLKVTRNGSIFHKNYSRNSGERQVVVTGIGLVTPLGCGSQFAWERLLAGERSISRIEWGGHEELPCRVAAFVPRGKSLGDFDEERYMNRRITDATAFVLAASDEALNDAGWHPETEEDKCNTGVSIGMATDHMENVANTLIELKSKGIRSMSPYFITKHLVNIPAGYVSIRHQLKGPNHCAATACASGTHSIGDAMRFIANGDCDVMVAGGTEACISSLIIVSFNRARAMCTKFIDNPEESSRPFDVKRNGLVLGEGAGVLVLEEENHARRRGARIYAKIVGYGLSGDAEHIIKPAVGGTGLARCMKSAVKNAGFELSDVTYINAHATSTPLGDIAECEGIETLFGDHSQNLAVSSNKGSIGHLLGAAGAVESAFTVLACYHSIIPPTMNLYEQDPKIKLNCVPLKPQKWNASRRVALCNSAGFGGTNASLCFSSV